MPILDLAVISGDSSNISPEPGFTRIPQDLNQGVGGKYIYLCYREGFSYGPFVTDITFVSGDSADLAPPEGYEILRTDLNQGAGGKFIYLCTRRYSNNWMEQIQSQITDRPLNRIAIPGTHDSATYSISNTSEFAPDDQLHLSSYGIASDVLKETYTHYSVTQSNTILQQLEAGIRYLDIRVATYGSNNQDIRITHGMWGTSVDDVISQLDTFLRANTKEIVIASFKYNTSGILTPSSKYFLLQKLTAAFGDLLAPPSYGAAVTPGRLWRDGKRLVVLLDGWIYDDTTLTDDQRRPFWRDGDYVIPGEGKDTMDLATLQSGLSATIDKAPAHPDKLLRLGGCLTPDGDYIAKKEFSTSKGSILGNCANPATVELVRWLRGEWRDRTINIFTTDYFQLAQTVDTAILRNVRPRAFAIHTKLNDFVIDVPGSQAKAGARLILWPQNLPQTRNQQWLLDDTGHIRSALDPSLVLDITNGSKEPGTPVQLWPESVPASPNQLWTIDGSGYIHSRLDPSLVLDVYQASTQPGTMLIVWRQGQTAANNQLFRLVEV